MKNINRQTPTPLNVPRTKRNNAIIGLSSLPAGKMVPIAVVPMLREDALSARVRVSVEMQETVELLMNPVYCRVRAFVVPLLAFERFEGSRDQFDRSYKGEPQVEGGDVVDFIETHAMGTHGSKAVYKALGLHAAETDQVNTAYLEAYNTVWNFLAKNRSPEITERTRLDASLAPAFWPRSRFQHVVPDFDQAVIDGEVALNVVASQLALSKPNVPVKGDGSSIIFENSSNDRSGLSWSAGDATARWSVGNNPGTVGSVRLTDGNDSGVIADLSDVTAEMVENGITVSLSNIELARKTQAFAKLRERYQEHDEEWIIDMLMDGLSIPDQALKQPILIADKTARFAQAKRYATDAGNLAESAVSGAAMVELSLRVPRLNTGGVVIVVAECLPEQLFERQRDPFFHSSDVDTWPEFLRDTLDPEKVDVVKNGEVDTDHATPNGTFGYAPMNWKWNSFGPRVGGKFYRPTTNTSTDEERQRLWAVENVDPVLGEDFYLVKDLHQKPFLDTESDPFECTIVGNAVISGLTQFGGVLVEATSNYDDVAAKAPTERIEKE